MTYRVEFAPSVLKELDRLESRDRDRVLRAVMALRNGPRPRGAIKLHGVQDLYRIRAGNYRVVYAIEDAVLLVLVLRLGHRREVYR